MKNKNKSIIDEIIRVNHAGEYGAQRIYSGQIDFCKEDRLRAELKKIIKDELVHYEYFDNVMLKNRTRPTLMSPIWHTGGYLLGMITSMMGEKYVHACTEAVEEVIVEHYKNQIKYLEENKIEKEMLNKIKKFCAEEDEHRSYAEVSNKGLARVDFFKNITKNLTRLAIKISKKV